jgi:hypothetical protein
VLDFGLAKAMDPAGASSADAMHSPTLTMHAMQMGMIAFSAPNLRTVPDSGSTPERLVPEHPS